MSRTASLTHLLELIRIHHLEDRYPQEVGAIVLMAEHGMLSPSLAEGFLPRIEQMVEDLRDFPNYLHRPPDEDQWPSPELALGPLIEAPELRFGIGLKGAQHTIVCGQTDSGKTCALRLILQRIGQWNQAQPDRQVNVVVLDPKGGDYADARELLGETCRHYSLLDGLRIGTNGPANVPPNVWINRFSTDFAVRAGLRTSAICIANIMKFLVAALNPNPQAELVWPSFALILEVMEYAPLEVFATKPDYGKSLMQVLEQIAGEETFQTFNGWDPQRDAVDPRVSAVIDTFGINPPWAYLHVVDYIAALLVVSRQYAFRKTAFVDTFFMSDEADVVVSHKAEDAFPAGALSAISYSEKTSRSSGVGVILGVSELGAVAHQIQINTTNVFALRTRDARSLDEAARQFLLRPGAEATLPCLEQGQVLARCNNGYPHAVLCQFDYCPPTTLPRPSNFDQHDYMPAKHLHELPYVLEPLDRLIAQRRRSRLAHNRSKSKPKVSTADRDLLYLLSLHLWEPVARLFDRMDHVSASAKAAARVRLDEALLAEFAEPRIGKRTMLLMEATDAGWQVIGKSPPKRTGRGGIAHRHYCHWIRMVMAQRGFKALTEWIVPSTQHPCDVAWQQDGRWCAAEVISECDSNIASHVRACLVDSDAVESLTIVAPQRGMLARAEKLIRQESDLAPVLSCVKFEVVETYLKELWP